MSNNHEEQDASQFPVVEARKKACEIIKKISILKRSYHDHIKWLSYNQPLQKSQIKNADNLFKNHDDLLSDLQLFYSIQNDSYLNKICDCYEKKHLQYKSAVEKIFNEKEVRCTVQLKYILNEIYVDIFQELDQLHRLFLQKIKFYYGEKCNEIMNESFEKEKEKIRTEFSSYFIFFVKSLLVINAGASVALLSYIASINNEPNILVAKNALSFFSIGAACSIVSIFVIFVTLDRVAKKHEKYFTRYFIGELTTKSHERKIEKLVHLHDWIIYISVAIPSVFFILGFLKSFSLITT